jgi:IS30 family transposase
VGKGRRNTENQIMNTNIVSAEAKARFQEAVRNYAQPASHKYNALEQVKESIAELRAKKASYETITVLLRDTANIDVSHQTVARYCREVLEAMQSRRPAKKSNGSRPDKSPTATPAIKPTSAGQSSSVQPEAHPASFNSSVTETLQTDTPSSSQSPSQRSRGPRIAHVRLVDGRTT